MRCDLHVHTIHSGLCNLPVLKLFCQESYSEPEAVYSKLKQQGMGLVTVTDHDSVEAAESLRRYPDFFVSEEVTCTTPTGSKMHLGVFDLNDRQHLEIQRRRDDLDSLLAFLREQRLFFSANHIFSSLTGPRTEADFDYFEREFDAFEVRNGCMLDVTNQNAEALARRGGKIQLAGSDAHTMSTAGLCWTEVAGARNKAEFFAGLRQGRGTVHGTSGSYWRLTRDILDIGLAMVQAAPLTLPFALLGGFAPLVTAINYFREQQFAAMWSSRLAVKERTALLSSEVAA